MTDERMRAVLPHPGEHWSDELLSAYLEDEIPENGQETLNAHLAECEVCRHSLDSLRLIVSASHQLEVRVPDQDLWPVIHARMTRQLSEFLSRPLSAGLIGLAAGWLVAWIWISTDTGPPPAPQLLGERFLLVLHEPPGLLATATPDETEVIVQSYRDWAANLGAHGKLEAGEKLRDGEGRVLRNDGDETRIEARSADGGIGGYFVIRAANYDEAVDITRTCPHLGHGGWVELRRIEGA